MNEDFYGAYAQEMTPQTVFRKHFEKLNPDQKAAFIAIAKSIVGEDITKKHCFFLKGFGGTGNSLLYIFQYALQFRRQNIRLQYTYPLVLIRKAVPHC
jgi:hypothetical protein